MGSRIEHEIVAEVSIIIQSSAEKVWEALTDPQAIKLYMFDVTVTSDWKVGSTITWQGSWKGKSYEDKGEIRRFEPCKLLQYTHYSPLSGLEEKPENYHTVTIELDERIEGVHVKLSQDNNPDEKARKHSTENWRNMLTGLKKFVEIWL